jgi:hypothetical protein
MVGQAPIVIIALAAWATAAAAQQFEIVGSCRDGQPHGAYELRAVGGQLRVAGAFNRGKRTSSFLFWTTRGVRVAHIPYDEDRKSGTISLWYADARPGRDAQQKLEAAYAGGKRNGLTRSWYPNGRTRAIFRYDHGRLVDARAFSPAGAALSDDAARAMASRDRDDDERYYSSLDAIVTSHLPRCEDPPLAPRAAL